MRFSNCLVVVRDFFAPKLPAQELPDKIKALKKKGFIPLLLQGSDDSDLISCNGFRHTDKYCEGLIPMRISNCFD